MTSRSFIQETIEQTLIVEPSHNNREARRKRIIAGAVQECSAVGFQASTMAGVAKRASVSTATVYREFSDKSDLLEHGMEYVIALLAQTITAADHTKDPFVRIINMLVHHGRTMGDPFMAWVFRLYVGRAEDKIALKLTQTARLGRELTENYWQGQLSLLEQQGHIIANPQIVTINLLLGQIERRTILAQLLYGDETQEKSNLEGIAHFAATGLFANLGTPEFHRRRRDIDQAL